MRCTETSVLDAAGNLAQQSSIRCSLVTEE